MNFPAAGDTRSDSSDQRRTDGRVPGGERDRAAAPSVLRRPVHAAENI